ncbi:MAG: hypothetical protein OER86_13350, partial [Phycisphaerae bacterium]|nr:hypothetical protein [Phycisphaerae bacterium]
MPELPEDLVDIEGLPQGGGRQESVTGPPGRRSWLAIWWRCCNTYSRVYRQANKPAYAGRCPVCGKAVHIPIRTDGTESR